MGCDFQILNELPGSKVSKLAKLGQVYSKFRFNLRDLLLERFDALPLRDLDLLLFVLRLPDRERFFGEPLRLRLDPLLKIKIIFEC